MSAQQQPTLTAAIITLNEAARLPDLLAALAWVDEIVVVDGGSTDGTPRLAAQAGCRVVVHPFDNFAAQRNRALRMASTDWVLSIDADERPTPALIDEVRAVIARGDHEAWHVPIRSRIFGRPFRYSGTQDDRPIRLMRRGAAVWQGGVHETLQVDGRVGRLENWLAHETIPNLAAFVAKVERYTALAARMRLAADRPPRVRDALVAPAREVFRRLIWKRGLFDGPAGWAFCLLSGWSEWVLARKHRALWTQRHAPRWAVATRSV